FRLLWESQWPGSPAGPYGGRADLQGGPDRTVSLRSGPLSFGRADCNGRAEPAGAVRRSAGSNDTDGISRQGEPSCRSSSSGGPCVKFPDNREWNREFLETSPDFGLSGGFESRSRSRFNSLPKSLFLRKQGISAPEQGIHRSKQGISYAWCHGIDLRVTPASADPPSPV